MEDSVQEVPKKGRHRKKQLYNSILQQMEFYFSDSNLNKDRFLNQLIEEDPFIDLSNFLIFNKIKKLTTNVEDIKKAVSKSKLLELSEDKTKIRRKTPVQFKDNVDDCTIYVERIKSDATHEWLISIFSEHGNVAYVSIPKYKQNRINKGFAFIEFENEASAKDALDYFESIGCKMSPEAAPEALQSIVTFEKDEADKKSKKRKLSESDTDESEKKKVKNEGSERKVPENGSEDAEEKKKAKAKKSSKRKNLKELGLQVLSKREWKKMRNRYLDAQKKQMKQLKLQLNRARFGGYGYQEKNKIDEEVEAEAEAEDKCVIEESTEKAPKLEYSPGVIVKLTLAEPAVDGRKLKVDLKALSPEIRYVDLPNASSTEVFLRFSNATNAQEFKTSNTNEAYAILQGEEERKYWEKIKTDRDTKFSKEFKKQRGRDKLLKRAAKASAKHIKFEDIE